VAVTNDKEFRGWLKMQPQEVCVAIAFRAAMRYLPLAFPRVEAIGTSKRMTLSAHHSAERLTLSTYRAALASGVAAVGPTPDLVAAASRAAHAARGAENNAVGGARAAARAAASAARAAAAEYAADAVSTAAYAASANAAARSAAYADTALLPDRMMAEAITLPPELEAVVGPVRDAADNAVTLGKSKDSPWSFWTRWYAAAMAGDPLPWELQEMVALIPNEIWEAGPEAVAKEIARIEAEYLAGSVAEDIVFSERGRLTLVPQPIKEADHLGYLLETVDDALDLAVAGHNELTEESYQARLIRRTLSRYANDPQRIEINFERARVSLVEGIAAEDLPASPATRDLIQSLSDAAGSIRESNPDVARNRERLNRIRLGEITADQARQIAKVAEGVAEDSEEFLQDELLEGIRRLPGVRRDDPVPDAIIPFPTAERNIALEQRDAQVLLFARLSKIWLYVKSIDREELNRVAGTPEFKWMTGLASVIGLIISLVR
jgi:hypothetical protein